MLTLDQHPLTALWLRNQGPPLWLLAELTVSLVHRIAHTVCPTAGVRNHKDENLIRHVGSMYSLRHERWAAQLGFSGANPWD